jgi:hypothetical protein
MSPTIYARTQTKAIILCEATRRRGAVYSTHFGVINRAGCLAETKTLQTPGGDRSMAEKRTSHMRWLLVIWMLIVSAIDYLDPVNILIAAIDAT